MTNTVKTAVRCWCGSNTLAPFSEHYLKCSACGTLAVAVMPDSDDLRVFDDDVDFYGKEYWLSHQKKDYNHPNIYERSRNDLPERSLYWLRALLRYKLPPGRTIDLGAAHGAFVALQQWVGFDAVGLELSPWVVNFAQQTFGISMVCGPVEEQGFAEQTFDVIALMDVLEHLPDPLATMSYCSRLLKPDGLLLIQTPCFRGGTSPYEQLLADQDPFVRAQLKEREHLFLFSQESIQLLLKQAGCPFVVFEPAIFAYDMFVVASKHELPCTSESERHRVLASTPAGRSVQALIDQDDRIKELAEQLRTQLEAVNTDREARLRVILDQQQKLADLHQQIDRQRTQLEAVSADSEARLRIILDQQQKLADLHQQIDRQRTQLEAVSADSEARLRIILDQQQQFAAQQAMIAEQQGVIDKLEGNLLFRILRLLRLVRV